MHLLALLLLAAGAAFTDKAGLPAHADFFGNGRPATVELVLTARDDKRCLGVRAVAADGRVLREPKCPDDGSNERFTVRRSGDRDILIVVSGSDDRTLGFEYVGGTACGELGSLGGGAMSGDAKQLLAGLDESLARLSDFRRFRVAALETTVPANHDRSDGMQLAFHACAGDRISIEVQGSWTLQPEGVTTGPAGTSDRRVAKRAVQSLPAGAFYCVVGWQHVGIAGTKVVTMPRNVDDRLVCSINDRDNEHDTGAMKVTVRLLAPAPNALPAK